MSDLIPYNGNNNMLLPRNNKGSIIARIIHPLESNYEGEAAIVLTDDSLWVCYPDGTQDVLPYQNIRETSVTELQGISFETNMGGKRVIVNPRDAYGVEVKHEGIATYRQTFTFLTFLPQKAYEWRSKIDRAINEWDKNLPTQF